MHTNTNNQYIRTSRVLVVSANAWPTAGQLASALVLAGFQVAVLCPVDSPVYNLRKLQARFAFRSSNSSASIKSAIEAWLPDALVCTDDVALGAFRSIYFEGSEKLSDLSTTLTELFEISFGSHRSLAVTQSKSELLSLAASLGIRCPRTTILVDDRQFREKQPGFEYPVMLKTDNAWGGLGVRLVKDRPAFLSAIAELSLPYDWPGSLKRRFAQCVPSHLFRCLFRSPKKVSIQQYVIGHPCTRAVVSWKGKVLSGITVDVLATAYEFGPATTVKIANRPDATEAAEKIVANLELSGFLGFDFVVDSANNAWFLEMNARATPICHISKDNHDLAGSFFSQITGTTPKSVYCNIHQDTFTLFPYETRKIRRAMPDLPGEQDAPVDEPEYVAACRAREEAKMRDWFWYSTGVCIAG